LWRTTASRGLLQTNLYTTILLKISSFSQSDQAYIAEWDTPKYSFSIVEGTKTNKPTKNDYEKCELNIFSQRILLSAFAVMELMIRTKCFEC
jgi:hypothetical protein